MIEKHVTLRPFTKADAKALAQALEDPELLSWLAALPIPLDLEACEKYMKYLGDPDVRACVICLDDAPVGLVSLGAELSFWMKRECHGQGLGLWAVRRFLEKQPATIETVTACCKRDNLSAVAILKRLGFESTDVPFRRFSFAHGHAVDFLRYHLHLSQKGSARPKILDQGLNQMSPSDQS